MKVDPACEKDRQASGEKSGSTEAKGHITVVMSLPILLSRILGALFRVPQSSDSLTTIKI